MKGILDKPFLDCQEFIKVDELESLNLEICAGIALSNSKAGVYGPGIVESDKFGNFMLLKNKLSKSPEFKDMWNKMTHNQQNTFAKLYFKLYNPSTVVYLREAKKDVNPIQAYQHKSESNFFEWTDNMSKFPNLKTWLDELIGTVFEQYGRIIFFMHEHDCKLLTHRDGLVYTPHNSEFIWINPMQTKALFVYDEVNDVKHYINTPVAFFNDLDMHGGDSTSAMTWSLRIDGIFTKNFKNKLNLQDVKFY
jgi:hypothetical protein